MQMISKLQDQLIAARTELTQLKRYTPDNPRVPIVETEMAAIERQMNAEMGKVTGKSALARGNRGAVPEPDGSERICRKAAHGCAGILG